MCYWFDVNFDTDSCSWSMGSSSLDVAMWMLSDLGGNYITVTAYEGDDTVLGRIYTRDDGVCYVGDGTVLKWIDPCWHYIDYVVSHFVRDGELVEIYRDGKWLDPDQLFASCFGDDGDPLFVGDY